MPGYLEDVIKEAKRLEAKEEGKGEKPKDETKNQNLPEKKEIASYGDVKIYKVMNEPLPIYTVPIVKSSGPEKDLIEMIKEAATRLITVSPEEIRDPQRRREYYINRVKEILLSSPELAIQEAKVDFYAGMVVSDMIGYGSIDNLVKDDRLEEIMVIGPKKMVYVFHRDYGMLRTNIVFGDDKEITNLVSRVAREVNRRVDTQNPFLDARLPDGSRVNATLWPVSADGATITIRKFKEDPYTIVDFIRENALDSEMAAFLWVAVEGMGAYPANMLISGGTGSGKTTTLNCMAAYIPSRERIVTIEDTLELNLPLEHLIRFETRPPGLEGVGEITMDMLLKNSLRMRPDRIIVGEIRHEEAFTLFSALNTGHRGGLGTVHANSAQETIVRLRSPPMTVPPIMLEALDLVVVEQKIYDRRKGTIRRITEIAELTGMVEDIPQLQVLYEWDPTKDVFRKKDVPSKFLQQLQRYAACSMEDIRTEIDKRKKTLEELCRKNIRSLNEILLEFGAYIGAELDGSKKA